MSPELAELADTSDDSAAARRKEPYRRAITGMYSRLAKTARELDHVIALRQPIVDRAPYASAAEFSADLATIALSLRQTNAGIVARGRLRALQRAVDVFGFHLAPIDLRQNSDVHERTIAELVRRRVAGPRLQGAERGGAGGAPASRTCVAPPAVLAFHRLRRGDGGRTRALSRRRRNPEQIRPGRDPNLDHLQDGQRLRHAGAGADPEGSGTCHRRGVVGARARAAVRDDRGSAQLRRRDGSAPFTPRVPQAGRLARPRAGGDARLFRFEQGRRLRHLGLGALQGGDRPGRSVPQARRAHPPFPWARRLCRARRRSEL